ncbi:unnamed protein product [Closterium sp. NIES-53]
MLVADFHVLRLHSDRGGEFSSALLGAFCRAQGIRQTFTLPASPQQNGIAERRIGMVMDVARTSMIHVAAPHFLWPFAVQYAAHQLNLQPRVSLPETSPTLLWTGKVGNASAFRVWGSRAFVRDLSADKLSPRAVPCVFLGFPPDAPGWQFDHPTSRRVLSSQDVTFDESVPYYRLFPYRTASLPPPPLFLAPGPPPVDPLPPQGPAPSGVSQVDAVEPFEVAVDSGAAPGTEPAGAGSGGAESGGAGTWGAEPRGAEPGGAEPRGAATGGTEPGGTEPGVTEPGGAEPGGAGSTRVASGGASSRREVLSPRELHDWFARRWSRAAGAGGAPATTGSGGTGPGSAGATGPSGAAEAAGVGPTGGSAGVSGGTGAAGSAGPAAAGATGVGAAGGVGAGGSADAGPSAGAGAGAAGARGTTGAGAPAGSPGAVPAGSGGASRPRPYFVPLLEQVLGLPPSPSPAPHLECPQPVQSQFLLQPVSPLPAPSPYTGPTGGLAERRAPASRPASRARPACTSRRTSRPRPPAVPGTHQMALRPSTAPLRVPLPSPPATSLPAFPDPESDSLRTASPTVARFLATVVTDLSLASTAASALVAELVDFAASCRLDYAASLVAESASVCPPSVGVECALSTDVLEDRQEEFQCFAAALPHLVSTLLAPEGDPDAPDIPTPRSYAEAIEGPYSSQWQAAMDAEMASWKSTGTYVDEVPPPGANIVSGMWIFRKFDQRAKWGLHLGIEKQYFAWHIMDYRSRLLVPARDCIFYENLTLPVFEQHFAMQENPATLFHGVRSFASADAELAASEEPDSDGAREAAPDPPVPVTSSGIPLADVAPEDVRDVHHTYLVDEQHQPMPVVSDSSIRVNLDEIGGASGEQNDDSDNFAERTDDNPHYQTGLQILGLAAAVQCSSIVNLEPKTARQALSGPHRKKWREAMDRELAALEKRGTWDLIPIEKTVKKNVLTGKWVFRVKTKADGTYEKHKARWVVRGFDQTHGIDYTLTFAPVSRHTSVRLVLCEAAAKNFPLRQIDVSNAFLYADVDPEIYVEYPHTYPTNPPSVCKLKKSLYGIKQAPRLWQQHLNRKLTEVGFRQLPHDPGMYRLDDKGSYALLVAYMDDILYVSSSTSLGDRIGADLKKSLDLTISTKVTQFLGLNVSRTSSAIHLTASKYAESLAKRFNIPTDFVATPYRSTLTEHIPNLKNLSAAGLQLYQQQLGCLLFAAVTCRPDLAYVASHLAQFLRCPKEEHSLDLQRALRYFVSTPTIGLIFNAGKPTDKMYLSGYVDTDHAGDTSDRRSRTGYIFRLEPIGPISWNSSKQELLSLSSAEAEFIAACAATREGLCLQELLDEAKFVTPNQFTLQCDNQSAITIANKPGFVNRTKHISLRYFFVKDAIDKGRMRLVYCPTSDMAVDSLTKKLTRQKFHHCNQLSGVSESIG